MCAQPSRRDTSVARGSIGGFCGVSNMLPLGRVMETEVVTSAADNGMNAVFGQAIHCVAAEPHATFVRIAVVTGRTEVAYETAVLARLRPGYRVFWMRSLLGTRIELCYLLVKIRFRKEPNMWPTPRQVLLLQAETAPHCAKMRIGPGVVCDPLSCSDPTPFAAALREFHASRATERGRGEDAR